MNPSEGKTFFSPIFRQLLFAMIASCLVCVPMTRTVFAQGSSTIEALGNVSARQVADGLGFNVNPENEWEFQRSAAAGATTVRFQCGWITAETQSAPPLNTNVGPRFVLAPSCQSGLTLSKKYGMRPTVLAAYGSPYHPILQLSIPGGAKAGATTIDVEFVSGQGGDTLGNIKFPYATIIGWSSTPGRGEQITRRHSYAGGLITDIRITDRNHATLTLASALQGDLPAQSSKFYTVNEYLYPPAGTFDANDPSVQAFAKYAEFLADSIAAEGLKGEVEIWNEPPWIDDPWDDRADFYDASRVPGAQPQRQNSPNSGFAAAIQSQTSPAPGVTYIWSGTNKSGDGSLYSSFNKNSGLNPLESVQIVTAESIHPYGNTPEDQIWTESCLKATIRPYPTRPHPFWNCNLFGSAGGNAAGGEQMSLVQTSVNPSLGVRREITETGFPAQRGDARHTSRFILRQFLGYQAQGVTPIQFYRLWDQSSDNFSFMTQFPKAGLPEPYPVYDALSGLMADLDAIKEAPVTPYSATTLPAVQPYRGTYPLDIVQMVGSRTGDTANSVLLTVWQRSNGPNWGFSASPGAAPVTVQIPAGLSVNKVVNLSTRSNVGYKIANEALTLYVSDDPVEIMLVPVSTKSIAITSSAASVVFGSSATLTCTATLESGKQAPCVAPSYTSSNTSAVRVQGNVATAEGVGPATITAAAGGTTVSTVLTATPAVPTVQIGSISAKIAGNSSFPVSASSPSFGAMRYSVVSGPASVSGQMVKPLGVGTVVIRAVQAAEGNYGQGQAQTSFYVSTRTPNVSLYLSENVFTEHLSLVNSMIRISKIGNAWPTGRVEVRDNSKVLWSYTIGTNSYGQLAGVTLPGLTTSGQHLLTVYYSGDANYASSISPATMVTVVPDQVTILGSCSRTQLQNGEPLSCTVTAMERQVPVTGVISYTVGAQKGTATLDSSGRGTIVVHPAKGPGSLWLGYAAQGKYPRCPYAVQINFVAN